MLRRLTVYLRRGLFVVGVVLLVLWPVSYAVRSNLMSTAPGAVTALWIGDGIIMGSYLRANDAITGFNWVFKVTFLEDGPRLHLLPRFYQTPLGVTDLVTHHVDIPLYLLAAVCLAWPVTSFVVGRRRRRLRGFEVEPVSGVGPGGEEGSAGTTR